MDNLIKSKGLLFPKAGMRENNLDFIRFFLAIVVLFSHCYVLYYGTEETVEPLWVWSQRQSSLGSVAVNFFFMISGFLILQSWTKSNDIEDFLKKRAFRIFPGFIIASAMCLLVFAPLGTADFYMPFGYWKLYYEGVSISAFFKNILLLQEPSVPWTLKNVPITDSINAPLWTIRYEFICYLVVPILAFLGMYKNKLFMVALCVLSLVLYILQDYYMIYYFNWKEFPVIGKPDFFPRFFTYFFAGMCYFNFKDVLPRSRRLFALSLIGVFVGVFFFKGLDIVLPLFGTYALFYVSFSQTITFKNFTKAGDFSYGIYVYAWPVQQLVIVYFEKYLNLSLMFILSVMFTIPLAWASWHFVEKPFLNFKKKKKEVDQEVKPQLTEENNETLASTMVSLHLN